MPAGLRPYGASVDADPESVLLHSNMGGSVLMSMHSDRKAAGHLAKAAGARSLVLNYRRSPEHKYPAQVEDVQSAYRWLLQHRIRGAPMTDTDPDQALKEWKRKILSDSYDENEGVYLT